MFSWVTGTLFLFYLSYFNDVPLETIVLISSLSLLLTFLNGLRSKKTDKSLENDSSKSDINFREMTDIVWG